ncbi:hypothetical protein ZWY2020_001129 [Hordeum vulgare]|nr:hypothetical protein ZWY2020_001129 [Hordeum vulgare]
MMPRSCPTRTTPTSPVDLPMMPSARTASRAAVSSAPAKPSRAPPAKPGQRSIETPSARTRRKLGHRSASGDEVDVASRAYHYYCRSHSVNVHMMFLS